MGYRLRGLAYEEWEEGRDYVTAARTVTEADVSTFAGLSGDFNPLHTDETFAATTPFGKRIAHGMPPWRRGS
jgi:acyl dehydratase